MGSLKWRINITRLFRSFWNCSTAQRRGQFQQVLKTEVILILNFTGSNWDYLLMTGKNYWISEWITGNARMIWRKYDFCTKISDHWQPGLPTNFQLWNYKGSAFLKKVKRVRCFLITQNLIRRCRYAWNTLVSSPYNIVALLNGLIRGDVQGDAAVTEIVNMAVSTPDENTDPVKFAVKLKCLLKEQDQSCQWLVK